MQPNISVLTYLVHPVMLSVYALHYKERIVWRNEYEPNILNIEFSKAVETNSQSQQESEHLQPDPPHF